jgi:MSHA pilin protein MshA
MKTPRGFTLIELVVVIVVLGILAVTAAPRMVDLQSQARISALQGLQGAMQGANEQLIGVAAAQDLDRTASAAIEVEGESVLIVFGYAKANNADSWAKLLHASIEDSTWGNDGADWYFNNDGDPENSFIHYMPASRRAIGDECFLLYTQADANQPPAITLTTNGC